MARAHFTQAELSRALKGALASGLNVARVEIDPADGKIIIVMGNPTNGDETKMPLDNWRSSRGAS
jgi:hypothetical protein